MIRKDLTIAVLLTFCLSATLFMVATTKSQDYDPWADLNGDGKIDILDVVGVTGIYASTGDPTKSVTVTNWPATRQQTVWYGETMNQWSPDYNASGFGHIHIMWQVEGLSEGESVSIRVFGWIINSPLNRSILAQEINVTRGNSVLPYEMGALSIPVPSEIFYFYAWDPFPTPAIIYLSFYLTYA